MYSRYHFIIVALLHLMVQSLNVKNFVTSGIRGLKYTTTIMSASDKIDVTDRREKYIHWKEYPIDDYNHILGFNDPNHSDSTLQKITALRIADVERSKTPIDTVRILHLYLKFHLFIYLFTCFSKDVQLIALSMFLVKI